LMDVYVEPHKAGGWLQGDDLKLNAVAHSHVMSDANGVIPATNIAQVGPAGAYDVVIDYDNDGKFSWKLDGVAAFTVPQVQPGAPAP
jgi:hypothetical protein